MKFAAFFEKATEKPPYAFQERFATGPRPAHDERG